MSTLPDPTSSVIVLPAGEPRWKRWLFLVIAIALTGGFWFFLASFLAPAPGRPGIDENAYLVGGRMIAAHGSAGFKPGDDYQFVGAMWVRTPSGWYYPKYPVGSSVLAALTVIARHPAWAFSISPLCASLAMLGMFFLARQIVGSFYALLAMIVLATGPTTLQLADLPNSHSQALFLVVWGMYFLLCWWERGRWQMGLLAGWLLGCAVTIRYSEALLLFPLYSLGLLHSDQFIGPKLLPILKVFGLLPLGPIGIAAISRMKWKSWRSYVDASVPIIAWGAAVGAMVIYNLRTVGHMTGYDGTNESSGFSVDYFLQKWDFSLYQIYVFGSFLIAPLGIAGLILMFRKAPGAVRAVEDRFAQQDAQATVSGGAALDNRRAALLLTLWFVPGVLLYMAYYWGEGTPAVAFLRFYLTLFPPLIIAAMYLLRRAGGDANRAIASPLAAGILVAATASIGIWGSLAELERQHRGNLNLHYSAAQIMSRVKPSAGGRPMILADDGMFPQLLQYMQFMLDADWYASDIFAPRAGGGFGLAGMFQKLQADSDTKAPVALQKDRIDYIESVRKDKRDADYIHDEQKLMDAAFAAGRRVYVVLSPLESSAFKSRFIASVYEMAELSRWTEPCAVHFDDERHNWLTLPVWGDDQFVPWHPQVRAMFEIRKAAATQPSTRGS